MIARRNEISPADRAKASEVVRAFEIKADEWIEGSPAWFGWGIHRAFLMGVVHARRQARRQAAAQGE